MMIAIIAQHLSTRKTNVDVSEDHIQEKEVPVVMTEDRTAQDTVNNYIQFFKQQFSNQQLLLIYGTLLYICGI